MSGLWTAALLLSWLAIAGLAFAVYALARQIGVLHERIRPAGALSVAPTVKPGEAVPTMKLSSLTGGSIRIGGPQDKADLLLFVAPDCPVCQSLLPAALALAAAETDWLRLVLASDGPVDAHRRYIEEHQLESCPYVLSPELGQTLHIGRLPYAVLIDEAGLLVAHGLCNSREHLDSLIEARERGVASVQQWIAQQEAAVEQAR